MSEKAFPGKINIVLMNLAICFAMLLLTMGKDSLTVSEIIAQCREALGGAERLAAIRTLRLTFSEKPDFAIDFERPNHIRKNGRSEIVFDGQRAAWLKRPPAAGGSFLKPGMIDATAWKDFEIDIAIIFPSFLDYPADYLGPEKVEGQLFHKLRVILPLGTVAIYYVDAKTFLTRRLMIDFGPQRKRYEVVYSDFRTVSGMLFPFRHSSSGGKSRKLGAIRINAGFGKRHFAVPENHKPK